MSAISDDQIANMAEIFHGLDTAHGIFIPTKTEGKKQIGRATTVRQPVDTAVWRSHLEGREGLGIIPINEESKVKWGVIDIDKYDLDFAALLKLIEDTPLVCCQSKSGGAHLFVFIREFVKASIVRDYLRNMVGLLGLGNSEIFPKQDRVHAERGDIGNWLNMPYFGNSRLCMLSADAAFLSIADFIHFVSRKLVNKEFFSSTEKIHYESSPIEDGPPCLQVMSIKGFPEHTRNKALFNVGIYAKRSMPDQWKQIIRNFNLKLFDDSGGKLSEREVEDTIKSLDKKDYAYQCYEEPLCSFCNAKLCRTRKYGISNIVGLPIINGVTKISGDISVWFIDVEGGRLEMTTEELYDNRRFIMKCLNDLNILPDRMKPDKWAQFVQTLVDQSIEVRDESMFERYEIPELFRQFCVGRLCKEKGDIEINRTYYEKSTGEIRFNLDSFLNFMKFRKVMPNKGAVVMYFKNRGSRILVAKDRNRRSIRCFIIPLNPEEQTVIEEKLAGDDVI